MYFWNVLKTFGTLVVTGSCRLHELVSPNSRYWARSHQTDTAGPVGDSPKSTLQPELFICGLTCVHWCQIASDQKNNFVELHGKRAWYVGNIAWVTHLLDCCGWKDWKGVGRKWKKDSTDLGVFVCSSPARSVPVCLRRRHHDGSGKTRPCADVEMVNQTRYPWETDTFTWWCVLGLYSTRLQSQQESRRQEKENGEALRSCQGTWTRTSLEHGWEIVPTWECLFVHRQKGIFWSVYVDDIKLAGKNDNDNDTSEWGLHKVSPGPTDSDGEVVTSTKRVC